MLTMLGVTVGFHRYFTHGAFRAKRALRIALAVAGSMAVQGPILHWVADHRRHHAFADREGDPHSPWLFGTSPAALVRGFWHAHMGWIFDREQTNEQRFAPDLLADRDIRAVNRCSAADGGHACSRPPLLGGLITWSWWGALTAFFWAEPGPRRRSLHHVTWSVELDLPHGRRAPFAGAGPLGELLAARHPVHGRVVAQPPPRRPHLRPPRRAAAARSTSPRA